MLSLKFLDTQLRTCTNTKRLSVVVNNFRSVECPLLAELGLKHPSLDHLLNASFGQKPAA